IASTMSRGLTLHGGALLHQERAARAAYLEAAEQYRSTVLTAFQNVADTLTALEKDAEALTAAAAAEQATRVTLDLTRKQWQSGYAGYLALLDAEQAYQQALLRHGRRASRQWLRTRLEQPRIAQKARAQRGQRHAAFLAVGMTAGTAGPGMTGTLDQNSAD